MANEMLRTAIHRSQRSISSIAEELEVDAKTVERWIQGRVPHRRSRQALANLLAIDETDAWSSEAVADGEPALESELVRFYPHRRSAPHGLWRRLFASAQQEIDILAFAATFLAEDAGLRDLLAQKATDGVRVRILLGDPDAGMIDTRGRDEGTRSSLPTRTNLAISLFNPLVEVRGIEIRLHATVLHNSIYRADDELLINTQIYGARATVAPLFRLHHIPGRSLATEYLGVLSASSICLAVSLTVASVRLRRYTTRASMKTAPLAVPALAPAQSYRTRK